jgi:hypothetical protein
VTPGEFAAKWRGVTTGERASAQSHFLDLCALLGEPGPTEADPTGAWYAFEKGAEKLDGHDGFADVWKRERFAWEYKGKRKDLKAAYLQLVGYKDALENPPLLVVSDLERIEVRTNFTNLSPKLYVVTLDDLAAADPSEALRILRAVFDDPEALRPLFDRAQLTEAAARHFAELAGALHGRDHAPTAVAHFLDKLLFCLFAEDTGLLPKGLLSRLADATRAKPADFAGALGQLFGTMASGGGLFGVERIDWFNGGLFDSAEVLTLTTPEIGLLVEVGHLDWSRIEPAIFGTLFERGLDPDQRTQLGAHYTSRDDIWRLVEPVVIRPLRREFVAMQIRVTELTLRRDASKKKGPDPEALRLFGAFLDRLRAVRILDPACGSGNFLYIALQALKDLELEAIQWGSLVLRIAQQFPGVGPEAVLGIEINPYAAELARVTIWIGEIQWMLGHGFACRRDPSSARSTRSRRRTPCWTSPMPQSLARPTGRPPSSSSAIRRFSARSFSDAGSATTTSKFCSLCSGIASPEWPTSAPTGTRRRARRSPEVRRGALDSSPPKESAAVAVAGSSSGSRRLAPSSSPALTILGSCPARMCTSASLARTTVRTQSGSSMVVRSQGSTQI